MIECDPNTVLRVVSAESQGESAFVVRHFDRDIYGVAAFHYAFQSHTFGESPIEVIVERKIYFFSPRPAAGTSSELVGVPPEFIEGGNDYFFPVVQPGDFIDMSVIGAVWVGFVFDCYVHVRRLQG